MAEQTETRLPWGADTITITGRNAGTEALTVHFDGEILNIIDFLNHSLQAEYAALYEEIMSRYEAKLSGRQPQPVSPGTLFDRNFPEAPFTPEKIDPSQSVPAAPIDDKTLIDSLRKEYDTCLAHMKAHFKDYEQTVEKWYNTLSTEMKKA